jgi:predicted ATPase with chaperone activity
MDPSKANSDVWRSPLHTSGSVASRPARTPESSGVKTSVRPSPLHTSESVASLPARTHDSSGVKSGVWRNPLRTSGSVAAQPSRAQEASAGKAGGWRGPLHTPDSVAELGVRQSVIEDLALRILYMSGPLSLRDLADQTRLSFGVVNELLRRMRAEQLCEVKGMTGNIPQIAITAQGRTRASELLTLTQYTGPAPVSLDSYIQQVREQSVRHLEVHPPAVESAFQHLVVEPAILEELGTALNSGSSIFLYGPSGTGKTTVATALAQVLAADEVWIPYAVEVDGQIISVYDPHTHGKVSELASQTGDGRWVLCHRPTVLVGGELTTEMLELQFNPYSRFYTAPVQMKANNGVLVIDDFGRQRLRPEELLNRWVVPLDRRIDFLTLAGGKKVEIPFELCVVFATNLDPAALADEAFLRRIQTKIKMDVLSEEQFHEIFQAVCSTCELQCDTETVNEVIKVIQTELKETLRACHPRDLVNRICWKARYKETKPCLDLDALLAAVNSYFVRK